MSDQLVLVFDQAAATHPPAATDTPEPSHANEDERRPRLTQLRELPGTTFEDIFPTPGEAA